MIAIISNALMLSGYRGKTNSEPGLWCTQNMTTLSLVANQSTKAHLTLTYVEKKTWNLVHFLNPQAIKRLQLLKY